MKGWDQLPDKAKFGLIISAVCLLGATLGGVSARLILVVGAVAFYAGAMIEMRK